MRLTPDFLLLNRSAAWELRAVDQAAGLYFQAACVNSTPAVVIYKLALTTGVISAQTTITATVRGTGDPTGTDNVNGGNNLTFYPNFELPRASLAIANSNVYVSFGSYADNHSAAWLGVLPTR